jgi:hypothetical protein
MFDFGQGIEFFSGGAKAGQGKSMGSNAADRGKVANCVEKGSFQNGFTTCNPLSSDNPLNTGNPGPAQTQTWDLTQWQNAGLLTFMGWQGAITGTGLNTLGAAIGKASLTYSFMVARVLNDICPGGTMPVGTTTTQGTQLYIAAQAQSLDNQPTPTTAPFGYIVASVASDPTCHW